MGYFQFNGEEYIKVRKKVQNKLNDSGGPKFINHYLKGKSVFPISWVNLNRSAKSFKLEVRI